MAITISGTGITSSQIEADGIDGSKIADNSIGIEHLEDDAVGVAELSASGTAGNTTFLRGDNTWAVVSIPSLDSPAISGTLAVNFESTVSHTISNYSDDVSYTITPTNCTVGTVNSSGVFVITHTSGTPSYTIKATTDSLGLDDSATVTKNIVLNLRAPTLSSPADNATSTNVVYTITSTDTLDDKLILDIGSSNFNYVSVSHGSGSKVGNTVEVTGFTTNNPAVTIQFTAEATYSVTAKAVHIAGTYGTSANSSADSLTIQNNQAPTNPTNTGDFPSNIGDEWDPYSFTFSGATDPDAGDSVTHYKVDTFTGGKISCSSAEVAAGSAHSFAIASTSSDTACSFRVRAKDSNGAYSTGVTINATVKNSTLSTYQPLGDSSCNGLWKLDGNVNETGGTNHLSWSGGSASYNSSGKFNSSAIFDGSSDYLYRSNLNFGNTWSFSFWMKSSNNSGTMFFNRVMGGYGHRTVQIETGRIKVYNASADQYMNWTAPSTGVWHHYVIAKNGSNAKCYIDNSLVATKTDFNSVNTGNSGLYFGIQNNADSGTSPSGYFNGELDQIRIFTKQVSSSEVTTLYNEV